MSLPVIAIVIPCYNEEEALPISVARLTELLDRMATDELASPESYIMCSNDGSRDRTWNVITELHAADKRVKGISLAHNRGHQYALLAGLMAVRDRCDAAISIDADLQDDPEAIVKMVQEFRKGKEIVYGVRSSRASDTWFKRTTAHGFYSFQKMMGLNTIYDHADYRLMSNRALDMLSDYGESNLFLRGIIPQIGLDTSVVTYERHERVAGESKYPLAKMLSFSIDGITSFSTAPLKFITFAGLAMTLVAVFIIVYALYEHAIGRTIEGWTSILVSMWLIGGVITTGVGITGVYIGKIYTEVKRRPRYFVDKKLNF